VNENNINCEEKENFEKKEILYEFTPYLLECHKGATFKTFANFNDAIDIFFS